MKRPDLAARNRGDGGIYEDRAWFYRRYVEDLRTFHEMAEEAGCSLRTIARWSRLHDVPVPSATERRRQRGYQRPTLPPSRCECGTLKNRYAKKCWDCRNDGLRGENNYRWAGDNIGVGAAHDRVKSARGSATQYPCQHCGRTAAHWAYDHEDPNERQSDDGPYSANIERYMPMCVSCHKRFDLAYLRRKRAA